MITSIELTDWKSFESARMWVDPLVFITGANSAGKSNIVDALLYLSYITKGNRLSDFPDSEIRGGSEGIIRRNSDSATIRVEVSSEKDEFVYEVSFQYEGKELLLKGEKLSHTSASGKEKVFFYTDAIVGNPNNITARFLKDKKGPRKGVELRRDVTILSQLSNLNVIKEIKEKGEVMAKALRKVFVLDPRPDRMRGYTPLADRLDPDGANIAGVIAGLPKEKKEEFEAKLTDYVRPLPERDLKRIWAEPVGLFKSDAMLYCAEEWIDGDRQEFDARLMSDGTLRFIAIVTALLTAEQGSTIVIEEVDNGLHPSRAGELVVALKTLGSERNLDVICTTHNPVLIDALGPEMVPFISFVSRSQATGASEIHLLEEVPDLFRLLAKYTPGGMMTRGILTSDMK